MGEHAHERRSERSPAGGERPAAQRPSLPSAVGNRAMARAVARMQAKDAVEAFSTALAPGAMGGEQRAVDAMTALSHDTAGFDQAATAYEKQVKAPLLPDLARVPDAAAQVPDGWFPGIAGKGG